MVMATAPAPAPHKTKVVLTGSQATLMATLRMRMDDANSARPVLNDTWAAKTVAAVDFDWDNFAKGSFAKQGLISATIAARARQLDVWATEFLDKNREATVLHLACGLDSRCMRLKWQRPTVRWIDVDMPDVVAIRRQLPYLSPASGNTKCDYQLVPSSVTEAAWLQAVPRDRPALIIMEGLLVYLERAHANLLFSRLVEHFSDCGGTLMFDSSGSFMVRTMPLTVPGMRRLGLRLGFTVDDPHDVEALHPHMRVCDARPWWAFVSADRMPWLMRIAILLFGWLPFVQSMWTLMRISF